MQYLVSLFALVLIASAGCARTQIVDPGFALPPGDAAAGKTAFIQLQCHRCHTVAGQDDLPAPTVTPAVPVSLGTYRASRPTDARLVTAIINPDHTISRPLAEDVAVEGRSRMADFNEVMTVRQMVDLVAYIRSAEAN